MHLRGEGGGRKETEHNKTMLIFKSKHSCISISQRLRNKKKYKIQTACTYLSSLRGISLSRV